LDTTKIDFNLEIDDGYPPISVERLNAKECDSGRYQILNSPFFAREVAYGDLVTANLTPEGRLLFGTCVKTSSFKALSIIVLSEAMDSELMDLFRGHNCVIEYGEFGALRMLAVGVPKTANYNGIRSKLEAFESAGEISYAELVA
jgi:hypothetical protein